VTERQRCRRDLKIMWTYHLTTRFQPSPNSRVMASMREIKGLHNDGRKNLFHMSFSSKLAIGILRPLDSMKKFGSRNCGNDRLGLCELAQKSGHIEFSPLICD
jgi:hypothetical protein